MKDQYTLYILLLFPKEIFCLLICGFCFILIIEYTHKVNIKIGKYQNYQTRQLFVYFQRNCCSQNDMYFNMGLKQGLRS